jgi:RNA polymerase sigma factor (TIGR02999 family)
MSDVTRILDAASHGDPKAAEELLPLVYDELRKLAAHRMAQEQPGQTLQPTALVHEAWLRLVGGDNVRFDGRGHFFSAAAEAMRRILIDRARQKLSLKRGARAERVNLDELEVAVAADDVRPPCIGICSYPCGGLMPPNDPATRPAGGVDCNQSAMAGFAAAHG